MTESGKSNKAVAAEQTAAREREMTMVRAWLGGKFSKKWAKTTFSVNIPPKSVLPQEIHTTTAEVSAPDVSVKVTLLQARTAAVIPPLQTELSSVKAALPAKPKPYRPVPLEPRSDTAISVTLPQARTTAEIPPLQTELSSVKAALPAKPKPYSPVPLEPRSGAAISVTLPQARTTAEIPPLKPEQLSAAVQLKITVPSIAPMGRKTANTGK